MQLSFGENQPAVRSMALTESLQAMGSEESTYEGVGSMERASWVVEVDYLAESWTAINGGKV